MSDKTDPTLTSRKIFPRNLTAFAATVVRGNPANARPESGVDNTHPGLEFDQRNLDKAFFPGLVFEFQYLHGAKLAEVHPELFKTPTDLSASDADGSIYLYYIYGAFGGQPDQSRLVELHRTDGRTDGYEVLRTIRDLEPGRLMVAIGPKDPLELARLGPVGGMEFAGALDDPEKYVGQTSAPKIFRDPQTGRLLGAILVGNRADYVDPRGLIALSAVPPGDLTRSLCAPWQWDFADCGCHYWASNKPDIVIGPDGDPDAQVLNFQRSDRASSPAVPASTYAAWVAGEMTQPEMIRNWEKLPFVIAEQETSRARPTPHTADPDPWTKQQVIDELRYLATIEHALCVEYLYAFYSLNAPRDAPPKSAPQLVRDSFVAAQVVRSIAVDEMRHFRWANEALMILGADVCLDRAEAFETEGRNQIKGHFQLRPLTKSCLDDFIQVEAPSQSFGQEHKLDGLYTHLLRSLQNTGTDVGTGDRRRLSEIVKLIIDEGHEHWKRFDGVKAILGGYDEKSFLRVFSGPMEPSPNTPEAQHIGDLQLAANWTYGLIVSGIREAFQDRAVARAGHIGDARLTMYSLDDIGQELARHGFGMFFTQPTNDQKLAAVQRQNAAEAFDRLRNSNRDVVRRMALSQIAMMSSTQPT